MRVAIAIWPAPAHLYPLTPLAWALRAAGHEVYFASHPDIGPMVTAQGLPFAPLGDATAMPPLLGPGGAYPEERAEIERISTELRIPDEEIGIWNTVHQFFVPAMWDFIPFRGAPGKAMPVMDAMVALFEEWRPDLVIWDPCLPGAAVAARKCGARHARYAGPDIVGWCHDAFDRLSARSGLSGVNSPLVDSVKPMAERYAVPIDRETLFGQWTINPMPPAINIPVDTRMIPVRWIPHAQQDTMPSWLYPAPERPRVALSLGVSVRSYLKADWHYVPDLLDALGEMDVEVVATLNETQLTKVTKMPDNVRIVDFVPLDILVPTCSAVIHHGGLATMIASGFAGVPQLVVDFPERPIIAERNDEGVGVPRYVLAPTTSAYIASHGAGGILDLTDPSSAAIRERVTEVLTEPAYRTGAESLREDLLCAPSPVDLVPILERLTPTR